MSETSHSGPSELLKRLLEASANSPLAEADPASLDELMARIPTIFNTRPLDLSDSDITDTVVYFRSKRAMFSTLAKQKADEDANKPRRGKRATTLPSSEDIGI